MCPSKPRYEVHSITGYTINPDSPWARKQSTSYCVLDTLDCFREVGTFYTARGRGGDNVDARRRAKAQALCDRLNAEDRADAA